MCYVKDYDYYVEADKSQPAPIGVCLTHYCNPASMEIQAINCGYIAAIGTKERPCHVTATDLTKSYPDCCPQLICKDAE